MFKQRLAVSGEFCEIWGGRWVWRSRGGCLKILTDELGEVTGYSGIKSG